VSGRKVASFIILMVCLGLSFPVPEGAAFKVGVPGASKMKMQLGVGQSYRIDLGIKIRSFSVSDPSVASISVSGTSKFVVIGKAPGSATVTYWTEANVPASLDVDVWGRSETPEERAELLSMSKPEKSVSPGTGTVDGSVGAATAALPMVPAAEHKEPFLVAVLPVENLSARPAPLKEIRQALAEGLRSRGLGVLPKRELEGFMARHRVRYTGGINNELALSFLRETGAKAVLIVSLEHLSDGPPPKISFIARLVSTGEQATILWTKSVGMSGDDHPGILGIGLILTPEEMQRKAVGSALDSLAQSVPAGMTRIAVRSVSGGKFRPKRYYRLQGLKFGADRPVTVAVVPFLNIGTRKYAGSLMELHFVSRLAQVENVRVIDPGVVREVLLQQRVIMQQGVSGPQAALLFSMLDADFLLTGIVTEYQDAELPGGSKVEFSVLAFDGKSRQVVWSSRSDNRGDDGVFFFNLGEVETAADLASQMVWSVVERMIAAKG